MRVPHPLRKRAPLNGHFHSKGKAPSRFTLEVLKQAKAKLPFADIALMQARPILRSVITAIAVSLPEVSLADEGGVSFWLPGMYGSLAAAPQQPGWSLATIYYHTSVKAGADVAFARQVSRGGLTTNFSGNLSASLKADADLGIMIPSYVFATPFLGGQAAVAMLIPVEMYAA